MTIDSRALIASGVEIGQAVFMEEDQPVDLSFFGRRYLQSGNIETDTALFDESIFTSESIIDQVTQTSSFGASGINGIAFGNGVFVAVGIGGKIATSSDRVTWTQRTNTFGGAIQDVTFGLGVFVAVGFPNDIKTSVDGIVWVDQVSNFTGGDIKGVTFDRGLFVAGCGSADHVVTSVDGATWVPRTLGSTLSFNNISGGGGVFLLSGASGNIYSSPDGIAWTPRVSNTSVSLFSAWFGGGMHLVGGDTGFLSSSPDGITWTTQSHSLGAGDIVGIGYISNTYIIANQSGDIAISSDGSTWTEISPTNATTSIKGFASDSSEAVHVGSGGELVSFEMANFAGSTVAHAENGENQYVRIS